MEEGLGNCFSAKKTLLAWVDSDFLSFSNNIKGEPKITF